MNVSENRGLSLFQKSVSVIMLSACLCSWGCASLQEKMSSNGMKPTGTSSFTAPTVTKQAQSSMTDLEAAAKKDISANQTVAQDKFNTMLQNNGLAK